MTVADPRLWAEQPPPWALPVTVAADLVLVREPGVLVSVGAICAYPAGFVFSLTIGLDRARVADRTIGFHAHTAEESASAARLQVTFPDGRLADSLARGAGRGTPGGLLLRFCGGDSGIRDYMAIPRCESQWWVSPLPPRPVEFSISLPGAAAPSGTGRIDASLITSAAARSQTLWPGPR